MKQCRARSHPNSHRCVLVAAVALMAACGDAPAEPSALDTPPGCDVGGGEPVEIPTMLSDAPLACAQWVDQVRGRVGRQSTGSFAIWTTDTPSQLGLTLAPTHTLGAGWFGPVGQDVAEELAAPSPQAGVLRYQVPPANGSTELTDWSPMYPLYNLEVPAAEHTQGMTEILPRHDLFAAVFDSQRIVVDLLWPAPEPMVLEPVEIYDPDDLAKSTPSIASAVAGVALVVGYPREGPGADVGVVSVVQVLSDADAEAAIAALASAGDEEGSIPYAADVEVIAEGIAEVGMSGSGMFDRDGRLVGVVVRASTIDIGARYVRALRTTWIVTRIAAAYASLSAAEQAAVAPFLESSVDN